MLFASTIRPASGTNIINTIRKGIKWGSLEVGEIIQLMPTENAAQYAEGAEIPEVKYTQKGKIIKVSIRRFCDIDDSELVYNFDPNCRNWLGLSESMSKLYKDFNEVDIITMVDMMIIEPLEGIE